jgi:hypothetical protein
MAARHAPKLLAVPPGGARALPWANDRAASRRHARPVRERARPAGAIAPIAAPRLDCQEKEFALAHARGPVEFSGRSPSEVAGAIRYASQRFAVSARVVAGAAAIPSRSVKPMAVCTAHTKPQFLDARAAARGRRGARGESQR